MTSRRNSYSAFGKRVSLGIVLAVQRCGLAPGSWHVSLVDGHRVSSFEAFAMIAVFKPFCLSFHHLGALKLRQIMAL